MDGHHYLWRITAPHFCAGIFIWNGTVMDTAPILRYMKGYSPSWIAGYCTRKGWQIEYVEGEDEQDN